VNSCPKKKERGWGHICKQKTRGQGVACECAKRFWTFMQDSRSWEGLKWIFQGHMRKGNHSQGRTCKTARDQRVKSQKNLDHFSICACHPCAGAMLIFSVSFQFYRMSPKRQYGSHSSAYKLAFGSFAGRFGTKSRVGRSFPSPQAIVLMPL